MLLTSSLESAKLTSLFHSIIFHLCAFNWKQIPQRLQSPKTLLQWEMVFCKIPFSVGRCFPCREHSGEVGTRAVSIPGSHGGDLPAFGIPLEILNMGFLCEKQEFVGQGAVSPCRILGVRADGFPRNSNL